VIADHLNQETGTQHPGQQPGDHSRLERVSHDQKIYRLTPDEVYLECFPEHKGQVKYIPKQRPHSHKSRQIDAVKLKTTDVNFPDIRSVTHPEHIPMKRLG
jgi:hypothetical protein